MRVSIQRTFVAPSFVELSHRDLVHCVQNNISVEKLALQRAEDLSLSDFDWDRYESETDEDVVIEDLYLDTITRETKEIEKDLALIRKWGYEEYIFDWDVVQTLSKFADTTRPDRKMGCVFFKHNRAVATDSRILVEWELEEIYDDEFCIPAVWADKLLDGKIELFSSKSSLYSRINYKEEYSLYIESKTPKYKHLFNGAESRMSIKFVLKLIHDTSDPDIVAIAWDGEWNFFNRKFIGKVLALMAIDSFTIYKNMFGFFGENFRGLVMGCDGKGLAVKGDNGYE